MNFITDQQHRQLKSKLKRLLSINKLNVNAMARNDMQTLKKYEKDLGITMTRDIREFGRDVAIALTKTKVDGNGQRSTAMTTAYNNLWTIGMFGSVFIDIKVKGESFRVHMMPNNDLAPRFNNVFHIERN